MNTEQIRTIHGDELKLCNVALNILHCNSLWVMRRNKDSFNISVTDKAILQHYFDKKYYLTDPSIHAALDHNNLPLKITLGTSCDEFKNNGFFYDLYNIFNITEFVSIQTESPSERYCFRFFTQDNRFTFMNSLVNNMPIIKIFMFNLIAKFHLDSDENQRIFRLSEFKGLSGT